MLHFSQIFRTEALTFIVFSLQTLYYNTLFAINASKYDSTAQGGRYLPSG